MKLRRIAAICNDLAAKSSHRHKHGAVIFRQGKIISRGYNETKRGVGGLKGYWSGSLHAEISSIIAANCNISGANLFVVRSGLRNSRPCDRCLAAIKHAGIKKLFYSHNGGIIEEKV